MSQNLPRPDYAASIRFLQQYEPQGPWCLTAIRTDQQGTETATFIPGEEEHVRHWLLERGQGNNVYFTVNQVRGRLTKKASKEDIGQVRWLHVDIDPKPGVPLAQEQAAILDKLRNGLKEIPPPTLITFSGGGYQAFWRLTEGQPVTDATVAETLARYNKQIELMVGGDHCHNIDRIMRLPGTINWPNDKKRKRGQVPTVAQVVEFNTFAYELRTFRQAALVQTSEMGFAGQTVKVSGNVRRLQSVDELPSTVSGRTKVVIVQGMDPDEPTKHNSRSEWCWYAVCQLVRDGVDDETIFSIITDPAWGISGHVLAQKNSEKYALRQIERAHEFAISPWLQKLNDKHAVIADIGGKCRIISEVFDHAMSRARITRQTFDDFRNRYCHELVQVGQNQAGDPVYKPVGEWWVKHPRRRQYETMIFAPTKDVPNAYNLWRGYGCEAIPGDCTKFLNHIRDVLCGGNEEHYIYLVSWMAVAVQKPYLPGQVAVVLKGKMGTGKSFFSKTFGSLFGRHYLPVSDSKHLVGNFNAHLRDCVVLFGDEAFYAGDKKHESILKTLITEEMLAVEAKGVDVELSPNCVHLILASNESWAVPAAINDRRFFILSVSDAHMQSHAYFAALDKELNSGGREALLHYLLTYNLDGFDVRRRPKTAALREEQTHSLSIEQAWWYYKLKDGALLHSESGWPNKVIVEALHDDYIVWLRKWPGQRNASPHRLSSFLRKVLPNGATRKQLYGMHYYTDHTGQQIAKDRPYIYSIPTLQECRTHWEQQFELLEPWPEVPSSDNDDPDDSVPF